MSNVNNANNVNKNIIDRFTFFILIENYTQIFIKLFKHWINSKNTF